MAIAWKVHPRWRFVLIGNRDEFHGRASAALTPWPDADLIAGRDLQGGGTWAGVDRRGRCAVVTNVRDPMASLPAPRSRGELPVSFLGGDLDPRGCAAQLRERAGDYAPFNLLMVDGGECIYLGNHPATAIAAVPAGLHGMSNGGFDVPWPKTQHLRAALSHWLAGAAEQTDTLWSALADRQAFADASLPDTGVGLELERRLSPVFIAGKDYGTRASTVIAIDYAGAGWIAERRHGPAGRFLGETILRF